MKRIFLYLWWLIVTNWQTTVGGFAAATICQALTLNGIALTQEQANALSAIFISIGALIPKHPVNPIDATKALKSFMFFILICISISGCGFLQTTVQAVGCDNITAIAAQAIQYACKAVDSTGLNKSAAVDQDYMTVGKDTTWFHVTKYSDGTAVVNWRTSVGEQGAVSVKK